MMLIQENRLSKFELTLLIMIRNGLNLKIASNNMLKVRPYIYLVGNLMYFL
jgi:hypothetical protein